MRHVYNLLAIAAAAGCTYGVTDRTFVPARSPYGVQTQVITHRIELRGELIETRDSGLVVLSTWTKLPTEDKRLAVQERTLRFLPFRSINQATFDQLGPRYRIVGGRPPTVEVLDRLRLVSRFPYGMSPQILAELLNETGQSSLGGIER